MTTCIAALTRDAAYAALCVWEEMTNPTLAGAPEPWVEMRERIGMAELRGKVLDLGAACDATWTRTYANHDIACAIWRQRQQEHEARGVPFFDGPPAEPGAFDWEFVPFWIRNCVDWTGDEPRVKGSNNG